MDSCPLVIANIFFSPFQFNCTLPSPALRSDMHYKQRPPFKTKHWRQLYESRISDIKTLKECAKSAAFVIIDAEPWGRDDSEPAEIGLSFLTPAHVDLELPMTLDEASNLTGLDTRWIRFVDRERREKGREEHRYGTQHLVLGNKAEETLKDIIESFQDQIPGGTPLILTGFAVVFELQVLSNLYPNILKYFTYWVDLQELASGVVDGITRTSLRDTLIACDFDGYRYSQDSQTAVFRHNAATDTVRIAVLLIRFWRFLIMEGSLILAHHLTRNSSLPDGAQMPLQPRNKRVIGKARDPDQKNSTHLPQEYIVRRDLKISTEEVCSASS